MAEKKIGYQTSLQLAVIPLILYGVFSGDAWWLLLSIPMFYFFRYIGITIFYHRMMSHGVGVSEIHPITKFILTAIAFYGSISTPMQMAAVHLQHHKYPDTEKDPHSPTLMGKNVLFTNRWKSVVDRAAIVAYSKDPIFEFFRLNFKKLFWIAFIILLIVNYKILIFGWLIPAGLTIWSIGYGVYVSHKQNRPVESVGWFKDIVLCAGDCFKHESHHKNPSASSGEGFISYTISLLRKL